MSNKAILNCLSALVIAGSSFLIYYLFIYSNKHPYKNISSFWSIATLISILIHQLISAIISNLTNLELYSLVIYISIINNARFICLLMRSISIHQALSYTNYHLSRRLLHNNFLIDNDKDFNSIFYNRRFKYINIFLGFIIALIVESLICIFLLKNSIVVYLQLLFGQLSIQLQNEDNIIAAFFVLNIICYALFISYFFFTISIFKFNLQNDLFKIKFEIVGSFFITYICYNLKDISYHLFGEMNYFYLFLFEMLLNIGIVILIAILTIIRYFRFKSFSIQHLDQKFDLFISNDVTLKLFKDYIKIYQDEYYRYLNFFIDSFRYINVVRECLEKIKTIKKTSRNFFSKRKYSEEGSLSSEDKLSINDIENQLKKMAKRIFSDYFIMNTSSDSQADVLNIDFPTDIYEKIDEQYRRDFSEGHFDEIFTESFNWVYSKLLSVYNTFISNCAEKHKLERILFYVYCFEISSFNHELITF